MKTRPVYILDPGAFTPAYCNSLVRALRDHYPDAELLTADFLPDSKEPADRVPGRRYYYQRISKWLRRAAGPATFGERVARWLGLAEYVIDLSRLFARCVTRKPVLHVQWMPAWPLDLIFLVAARAFGSRIVYTVHNPVPHDTDSGLLRRGYGAVYRRAHHLILHSEFAEAEFERQFPEIETPRSVIPIGVLFDEIEPMPKAEARSLRGWPEDELVIVFLGLIKPYKGFDLLLRALAEANTERRFRLVVGATWRYVEDRSDYDALLRRVEERHSVELMDTIPDRDTTVELMSGADLSVLPYREASASAPGMIAMRFGVPMIASNTGSFPGMLGEELAEWLVPVEDAEALRGSLERFGRLTAGERSAISEAVRQRGEREYSWDRIAARTAVLYRGDPETD